MRRTLLLAVLTGCGGPALAEDLLTPPEKEIVAFPDRVEVFRLTDGPIIPGARNRIEWQDWPANGPALVALNLALAVSAADGQLAVRPEMHPENAVTAIVEPLPSNSAFNAPLDRQ